MLEIKRLLLEKDFTINNEWEENDWAHFDEGIKFDKEYQVIKENYLDGTIVYMLLRNGKTLYHGRSKWWLLHKIKKVKKVYVVKEKDNG